MEKNKLEIFEELKAILKETTNSATSTYGCNNPRKITDKDMEVFKRAFLVYQKLYSEYLKKAENRIKDRRLMHELSYLLGQFATNEVQMLKHYANRFKAKKELIIK